ncbi:sulfite exporter TauE/SafE family protein [Salicibibacter cibarius]|uniref:Probable membrane transporter protein n=1 Tax=Salicibibacter cibarius TaxID=2743000 RepID=A0A7T6Z2G3_9BACI|nr:sulfite exporter TauE/SafE family protein [Salicibibacter cibarius]QQK75486.1 sulfite exporter TauE/SafE family protein [Salicibibacter cibarius]
MDTFIFVVIILVASILQTSTGFGFSILATPFLLIIFDPIEAIQINLILSIMISLALLKQIKKDMDIKILKRFVIGSLFGLPTGIMTIMVLNIDALKLGIGLMILLLTMMLILKFRLSQTQGRDLFVGGLSGSLTSSIGMPGPPIMLYFSGADIKKEKLRGTTLAFYLFIYTISLFTQIIVLGTNEVIWFSSGLAVPLVLIGLYLGQLLFKWIHPRLFQVVIYILLLFTAIYLLIDVMPRFFHSP